MVCHWRGHVGTIARTVSVALAALVLGCSDSLVGPKAGEPQQLIFLSAAVPEPGSPSSEWWGFLENDIFRMNSDGTGVENLTKLPASYGGLALSPDGRKVAFHANRDSCPRIWTMNVDGSDLRALTTGDYFEIRCNYMPRWSRDGSYLAFRTSREGRWSTYVMNADGSNARSVSGGLDEVFGGAYPSGWAPDGRLVFYRYTEAGVEMYIVSVATNHRERFGQTGDRSPAWSPDGSKVAFIRDVGGQSALFVMNSDGSGTRRLTNHPGDDEIAQWVLGNQPTPWSSDGSRIAFLNEVGGNTAVDVIQVDGSGHRRLAQHVAGLVSIDGWSADGRIAFSRDEGASSDVFLIEPDGTGLINLTASRRTTHDRYAVLLPRQ